MVRVKFAPEEKKMKAGVRNSPRKSAKTTTAMNSSGSEDEVVHEQEMDHSEEASGDDQETEVLEELEDITQEMSPISPVIPVVKLQIPDLNIKKVQLGFQNQNDKLDSKNKAKSPSKAKDQGSTEDKDSSDSETNDPKPSPQTRKSRSGRVIKPAKDLVEIEKISEGEVSSDSDAKDPKPSPQNRKSRSGRIIKPVKDKLESENISDNESTSNSEKNDEPLKSSSGRSIKTRKLFQIERKSPKRMPRTSKRTNKRINSSSVDSSEERDKSFRVSTKPKDLEKRSSARRQNAGRKSYALKSDSSDDEDDVPLAKRSKTGDDKNSSAVSKKSDAPTKNDRDNKKNDEAKQTSSSESESESENEDNEDPSYNEKQKNPRRKRAVQPKKAERGRPKSASDRDNRRNGKTIQNSASESNDSDDPSYNENKKFRAVIQPKKRGRLGSQLQKSSTRNGKVVAKKYHESDESEEQESDESEESVKDTHKGSKTRNLSKESGKGGNRVKKNQDKTPSKSRNASNRAHNVTPYYVTPVKVHVQNNERESTQRSNRLNMTIDQDEEYIDLKKLHLTKQIELMDHEIYLRKLDALKKEQDLNLFASAFTAELTGNCNLN